MRRPLFVLFVASAWLAGCTSGAGPLAEPLPGSGGTFDENCPVGPTGISAGDLFRGYEFEGYVDPSRGIGEAHRRKVSFCSFYNPTGDELYGPGTAFEEGSPKPLALMINLSAMWCQPCKREAEEVLPEEYAKYGPRGLEIVMVLADTTTPGQSASFSHLDAWVSAYDVQYVATIDPARELTNAFSGSSSYPSNILVDPRTMQVVTNLQGLPDAGFLASLESLLDD